MTVFLVIVKTRSPDPPYECVVGIEAVFDNRAAATRWASIISEKEAEVVEFPVHSEPLDAHRGWES